jgi:hypothetical protein
MNEAAPVVGALADGLRPIETIEEIRRQLQAMATIGRGEVAMALSQSIDYICSAISNNIHRPIRPQRLLVAYGLLRHVGDGGDSILDKRGAAVSGVIPIYHVAIVSHVDALIAVLDPASLQLHLCIKVMYALY